jgi:type I restriction enzyme M protein
MSAYEWLMDETKGGAIDRALAKRIKRGTYYGQELVDRPRRLALMNLFLHGLEPTIKSGDSIYEVPDGRRFDLVLTNPPFGTKGANQAGRFGEVRPKPMFWEGLALLRLPP